MLDHFLNHQHPTTSIDTLTIEGGYRLPLKIGPTIQHLILRRVNLPGYTAEMVSENVATALQSNQLESLSLISMSISTELVTALTKTVLKNGVLQNLDLTDSRLYYDDGGTVSALADGLNMSTTIRSLCVSECHLMDEQISELVRGIGHHPSFRELNISFNKCRSFGMSALARLLRSSTPLTKLGMSFLAFGQGKRIDGVEEFCRALSANTTLEELEMGGNSFRDDDLPDIVNALCSSHVESLDLSQNRFTDLSPFVNRLHEMKHLRWLSIEDNRLTKANSLDALVEAFTTLESSQNQENDAIDSPGTSVNNYVLEDIEMDFVDSRGNDSPTKTQWNILNYYLDLNWGGRRFLISEQGDNTGNKIPISLLWPQIMERCNFPKRKTEGDDDNDGANHPRRLSRKPVPEDIICYYLRTFPVLASRNTEAPIAK